MDIWLWLIVGFVYAVFTVAAVVVVNKYEIIIFEKNNQLLEIIKTILWPVCIIISMIILALKVACFFLAAILVIYFFLKDCIAKTLKIDAKANLQ